MLPWWEGGLKASANPARVSGVGSVDEIAATCPGVSTELWSLSLPSSEPALAVFLRNWAAKVGWASTADRWVTSLEGVALS